MRAQLRGRKAQKGSKFTPTGQGDGEQPLRLHASISPPTGIRVNYLRCGRGGRLCLQEGVG